jgi:hypothetical protein
MYRVNGDENQRWDRAGREDSRGSRWGIVGVDDEVVVVLGDDGADR